MSFFIMIFAYIFFFTLFWKSSKSHQNQSHHQRHREAGSWWPCTHSRVAAMANSPLRREIGWRFSMMRKLTWIFGKLISWERILPKCICFYTCTPWMHYVCMFVDKYEHSYSVCIYAFEYMYINGMYIHTYTYIRDKEKFWIENIWMIVLDPLFPFTVMLTGG